MEEKSAQNKAIAAQGIAILTNQKLPEPDGTRLMPTSRAGLRVTTGHSK